jgi:hypothetical protein
MNVTCDSNAVDAARAPASASTELLIPVFDTFRVRGWPGNDVPTARYLPIKQVLTRTFDTDACLAAYSVPHLPYRLRKPAVEHASVTMVLAVIDVDDPVAHQTDEPSSDRWYERQCRRAERLFAQQPGGFAFRTRRGLRIAYRLARPYQVETRASADGWRSQYLQSLVYVADGFGLIGDPLNSDWPRLHRVPHGTRDGSQPERRETMGVPDVGVFRPEFPCLAQCVSIARSLAKRRPEWGTVEQWLGRAPRPDRRTTKFRRSTKGSRSLGYVNGAIRSACRKIEAASSARNNTLNAEAFSLARFVQDGILAEGDLVRSLTKSATRAGLREEEIRRTIASALQAQRVSR